MRRVSVIINPISGSSGRPDVARRRAEQAAALLTARGVEPEIVLTERQGHAHALAAAARERRVSLVVAWGGDGTVNEVASALAFGDVPIAIVPSGSGNGLARELGIPLDPEGAFDVAFRGRDFVMDAGRLDGRLFFNVAGVGLDAHVAHRFAARGLVKRGFSRYAAITLQQLFSYHPDEHTIATDDDTLRERALLIAIANARQYGNGAIIAPGARLDDGRLDVVVVRQRSPLRALLQLPMIFSGKVEEIEGVTMRSTAAVEITSGKPVLYHVDGEPFVGGASIRAAAHPGALKIRVPSHKGHTDPLSFTR